MAQAIGSLRRRDLLSAFGPLALWIGVIFFLSSSLGSMSHTSMLIRPVLELLFPLAPDETLRLYHAYVRKAAHFIEYAVLAAFAVRAFSSLTNRQIRTFLYGLLTVVLVSVIDEVNQSFDASRTGSLYDALIDISGGISMLAILWIWQGRIGGPAIDSDLKPNN